MLYLYTYTKYHKYIKYGWILIWRNLFVRICDVLQFTVVKIKLIDCKRVKKYLYILTTT